MRGFAPQPTRLKVLRGNPGRRPLPENEPVVPEGEIRCPKYLSKRAKVFWRGTAPILQEMGVLTVADVGALAELCETEAEYWTAREDVRARGVEVEKLKVGKNGESFYVLEDNPNVRIASDAQKRSKAMMVEFGMTPSARTRVKAVPKVEEKSELQKLRERRQG